MFQFVKCEAIFNRKKKIVRVLHIARAMQFACAIGRKEFWGVCYNWLLFRRIRH